MDTYLSNFGSSKFASEVFCISHRNRVIVPASKETIISLPNPTLLIQLVADTL